MNNGLANYWLVILWTVDLAYVRILSHYLPFPQCSGLPPSSPIPPIKFFWQQLVRDRVFDMLPGFFWIRWKMWKRQTSSLFHRISRLLPHIIPSMIFFTKTLGPNWHVVQSWFRSVKRYGYSKFPPFGPLFPQKLSTIPELYVKEHVCQVSHDRLKTVASRSTFTDRQTDRQTDRRKQNFPILSKRRLLLARYVNKIVRTMINGQFVMLPKCL